MDVKFEHATRDKSMDVRYEHLRVKVGDRVKITVTHRDFLTIIAEGPVLSAYDRYVYKAGTEVGVNKNIVGYQPAGIEMTDERTNHYRYWKAGDGGIVEKIVDTEYIQVYPIHFEGEVR